MTEAVWLLFAYAAGTVFTIVFLMPSIKESTIGDTIDALVEKGFLRYKKNKDGDIEILKWNDNQN